MELSQKGIDKELIEEKLSEIDQTETEKAIKKIIIKKAKLYLPQKMIKYLIARGFEYNLVKKSVDEWLQKS